MEKYTVLLVESFLFYRSSMHIRYVNMTTGARVYIGPVEVYAQFRGQGFFWGKLVKKKKKERTKESFVVICCRATA